MVQWLLKSESFSWEIVVLVSFCWLEKEATVKFVSKFGKRLMTQDQRVITDHVPRLAAFMPPLFQRLLQREIFVNEMFVSP
jgi:hypothetical protein